MKKIIIFDLDGTLLDTLYDMCDSINAMLTEFSYTLRTAEEIKTFVGNGARNLVRLSLPDNSPDFEIDKCLAIYKKKYSANLNVKTRPFKGIEDAIKTLHEKGFLMGVVSNKPDNDTKTLVKAHFGSYINIAVGDNNTRSKKPSPENVFYAIKLLHGVPEESVMIGDSEPDIRTAKNAGIISVGVCWGFRSRSVLLDEKADYIIDSPHELIQLLESL